MSPTTAARWFRTSLVLLIVITLLLGGFYFRAELSVWVVSFTDWTTQFPLLGPILFVFAASSTTILMLPTGFPMNLMAGLIWGGFWGGLLTLLAAGISGGVCFLASRKFSHRLIDQLTERPVSRALLQSVEEHDTLFVALARINPMMPFALASYLFGISRIGFRKYIIVSVVASAPGTFLFAYIGAAVHDVVLPHDQIGLIRNISIVTLLITVGLALKFALPRLIALRDSGT